MAFAIAEVQTIGQTFCVGSIPSTRFARPQAVAMYLCDRTIHPCVLQQGMFGPVPLPCLHQSKNL